MRKVTDSIVLRLSSLSVFGLTLTSVFVAVVISELLVILQSALLTGNPFEKNYLIVGFITPLITSFLLCYLMAITLQRLKSTTKQALRHEAEQKVIADSKIVGVAKTSGRTIVWVNKAFEEMYGADREEILGISTKSLYGDEESYERVGREAYPVMLEGKVFNTQMEFVRKDGQKRWVSLGGSMIQGTQDAIWIFSDINDMVEANERLKVLNAEQKAILDVPNVGIFRIKNRHFIWTNSACENILGYEKGELCGKPSRIAYASQEEYDMVTAQGYNTLKAGDVYRTEVTSLCKDGRVIYLLLMLAPLSGQNQEAIGAIIDITDRVLAEQKLKNINENLQYIVQNELAKNREKDSLLIKQSRQVAMGEMISSIAHNWRQPLNALAITVQDVKFAWKNSEVNDAYVDEMVNSSMAQIKYMSKTIDDFRLFFKPDKEKVYFRLESAIRRLESMMQASLNAHDIVLDINSDDGIYLFGYENELIQALLNMIGNSKDAFLERGIHDGKIVIETYSDDEYNALRLSDNAGGIDEAVLDKIFEPYFTTKEQGKGTGIGLYMTKIIIEENMNGTLKAYNENGGAVFEIKFDKRIPK